MIIIGTILSALYPAFVLSSFKPVKVLKGKFSHSSGGAFLRKGLAVFQFTISIILIIGTLTVYNQLSFLRDQDLGMNIQQVLSVKIGAAESYSTQEIKRFKSGLLNYPAIKSVTASSTVPGREYSNASSGIKPLSSSPEDGRRCFFVSVDYDFIDFFDIKILTGRKFSKEFDTKKQTLILNEKAVQLFGCPLFFFFHFPYGSPQLAILCANFEYFYLLKSLFTLVKIPLSFCILKNYC